MKKHVVDLIPPILPACINHADLEDFISSRREIGKPLTPTAMRRIISKLAKLDAQGHCTSKLLDRSIIHGWRDVFESEDTFKDSKTFEAKHTDTRWREGI